VAHWLASHTGSAALSQYLEYIRVTASNTYYITCAPIVLFLPEDSIDHHNDDVQGSAYRPITIYPHRNVHPRPASAVASFTGKASRLAVGQKRLTNESVSLRPSAKITAAKHSLT
jgi:hypothetical protein